MYERQAKMYFHIANWFALNDPGEPVPEWCELSWPIIPDQVEELIEMYEKDTNRKIEDGPFPW